MHITTTPHPNVRIVSHGDPFNNPEDLVVETLKDGEWVRYRGFNTFSNDYAYSNAHDAVQEAIAKLK